MITTFAAPEPSLKFSFIHGNYGIFLAGPILGAGDWQSEADVHIRNFAAKANVSNLSIFNPRRPEFTDLKDFDDTTFYQQVDWEHTHLASAHNQGVRLFWLAKQTIPMPHRSYGLTTMFELGEAIGDIIAKSQNPASKIIVGIEEGFTNEKYLRYTIAKKSPTVILASTLKETCQQTINWIKQQRGKRV